MRRTPSLGTVFPMSPLLLIYVPFIAPRKQCNDSHNSFSIAWNKNKCTLFICHDAFQNSDEARVTGSVGLMILLKISTLSWRLATVGWMGQDGEDVPGVLAAVPQDLLVHPLPGSPCQPRRTHIQVFSRKSGTSLSIQFSGECWLWPSRGAGSPHRPSCCRWHLLRML